MAESKKPKTIIERGKALRDALRSIDEAGGTRLAWTADTQTEVAEFFGVSIDTVKNWAKQKMPGSPRSYRLDKIAIWLRTEGPGSSRIKGEDDPLMDGDSPGLERYRMAKAKLAELDLESRKGELIDREKARDILGRWATLIRRMGERLAKRWGNEAATMVNDTLEECRLIVEESLDDDSAGD
jgi:transcriptional regulator with XRE-family HTH domain